MQTGLFYPLKLLVYLMPLDSNGLVSERIYNQLFVLSHLLAAIFMFFLGRSVRLSPYASVVAGLAFGLGGYIGNTGHLHTLDSGIWLPLIVLLFLRSIDAGPPLRAFFLAALSGIGVGMAILGGGLHMVIMDAIVVGTMAVAFCAGHRRPWRVISLAGAAAVAGLMFGAIQLLPSFEYAPLSYRWVGGESAIESLDKVPYAPLGDVARFSPRAVFSFLFRGVDPSADFETHNYIGVLPLFLSVIGAWQYWRERWVKYLAVLGILSFLYTWGSFSFLHGVLYLLPVLDMAREASRFVHITHFSMALLAGYGIDHLFGERVSSGSSLRTFVRFVRWIVILLAALLMAGTVQTTVAIADWAFTSFFFIGSGYILLELLSRGFRSGWIKSLLVFLLLSDLYAANWVIQSRTLDRGAMSELLKLRTLASFLKSNDSLFRIHFDADSPPNIGDTYGIHMTGGMSATMLMDYSRHLGHGRMASLLNVRYTLRRTELPGRDPVFSEDMWRVYENPDAGDRAWVVQEVEIDPSAERPQERLSDPDFDPKRVALLEGPLPEPIESSAQVQTSLVENRNYGPTSMEFLVITTGRRLLVVSEVFYPGWQAFVNDSPAPIYRVDGLLRGVVVPDGRSVVRLEYRPLSVRLGAALTLAAMVATGALGFLSLWRSNAGSHTA